MNHEQWTALLEATKGHTPGPWFAYRRDPSDDYEHKWDGIGPIRHDNPCHDDDSWVHATESDAKLAAAAPDLLAEVERLRGWIAFSQRESPTARLVLCADAALDGAEVPE